MFNTLAEGTVNSLEGRRYYGIAWVWRRLIAGLVDWLLVIGWGLFAGVSIAVATATALLFTEYSFQVNLSWQASSILVFRSHVWPWF